MAIIESGCVLRPNHHSVAAFDLETLSGCHQLVVGQTHACGETLDLLMTDFPDLVRVAVLAYIGNSDHFSLSAVISKDQAVLKHQVNWNTVCGAINCCSPGLLHLYIYYFAASVFFVIFYIFLVWLSEHKASNFSLAICFSDFKMILGALRQHCFRVYCPFASEGSFDDQLLWWWFTLVVQQVCSDPLLSGDQNVHLVLVLYFIQSF